MPEIGNTAVFSQVDGSNNSGTQPSFAEGQTPSSLNDGIRALQGAITREWNWRNPTLTTTGSANAYVLTYSVAPAALYNGQPFAFFTNFANTGSATLNINTLGAKTIKKVVAGVKTALASGDVASGALLVVAYNSGDDSFLILSGAAAADVFLASANAFTGNNTHAGTETFNNTTTIAKEWALTSVLSPAQITSNQDNYAPSNHATAAIFRLDLDAARTITGLAGGISGRIVIIENISAFTLTLAHDVTSTAANRFYCPGAIDAQIRTKTGALLYYDNTASRWTVIMFGLALADATPMEAASSTSLVVTPGDMHRHPGHPKFWAFVTVSAGTPTLQTSYNVTSITDTAAGKLTITIATDFSSANWCLTVTGQTPNSGTTASVFFEMDGGTRAAGSIQVAHSPNASGFGDPTNWSVSGKGDQ